MNEKLIRMAVDILIPVGDRAAMINDLQLGLNRIIDTNEKINQIHADMQIIMSALAVLTRDSNKRVEEAAEIAEEVATEVAEEVAFETAVNLEEGFTDNRTSKNDYPET